jgi:hypothetical protein
VPPAAAWGAPPAYPYPQQPAPGYGPYPPQGGYPGYPAYPGYPGYPMGYPGPNNGTGTAAMVLGIVGTVLSISCFGTVLGIIASIAAVICGSIGLRNVRRGEANNRTQARSGLIMGIIGIVLAVAVGVVFAVMAANGSFDDNSDGHGGTVDGVTSGPVEPRAGGDFDPLTAGTAARYPDGTRVAVGTPHAAHGYDTRAARGWRFTVTIHGGDRAVDARQWDVEAFRGKESVADLTDHVVSDQVPASVGPGRDATAEVVVLVPRGSGTVELAVTPGTRYDDAYWQTALPVAGTAA